MLKLTKHQLSNLANKWLKGTITEAEKQQLDEWYELNDKDRIIWTKDENESQLSSRLFASINQQRAKTSQTNYKWMFKAAAAILVFFFASFYWFYTRQQKTNIYSKTNIADIKPGGNKAALTLSDGRKIILNNTNNGQVAVDEGIKITKTASGQLVYETANKTGLSNNNLKNTIETPAGGQWQIILPDQSKVWLNSKSKITYPTKFIGQQRVVYLDGEAYFEVTHDKNKPFKVISGKQTIEVLGTHFNVTAYRDEPILKTTLLEGAVKVNFDKNASILKPGEQAQVAENTFKIARNIDIEAVTAWKDGYFKFDESLKSIMDKIARWYDVEISYQPNVNQSMPFGGKISMNKSLASTLKIMELTGNIHFKTEKRRVIVMP